MGIAASPLLAALSWPSRGIQARSAAAGAGRCIEKSLCEPFWRRSAATALIWGGALRTSFGFSTDEPPAIASSAAPTDRPSCPRSGAFAHLARVQVAEVGVAIAALWCAPLRCLPRTGGDHGLSQLLLGHLELIQAAGRRAGLLQHVGLRDGGSGRGRKARGPPPTRRLVAGDGGCQDGRGAASAAAAGWRGGPGESHRGSPACVAAVGPPPPRERTPWGACSPQSRPAVARIDAGCGAAALPFRQRGIAQRLPPATGPAYLGGGRRRDRVEVRAARRGGRRMVLIAVKNGGRHGCRLGVAGARSDREAIFNASAGDCSVGRDAVGPLSALPRRSSLGGQDEWFCRAASQVRSGGRAGRRAGGAGRKRRGRLM
jgi:hypothetical protein